MLKSSLFPFFQLLSSLEQGPLTFYLVSVNISGCSATQPYKEPLISAPPINTPTLLLCDVVAQTVKVNHSGLYIYEKKKIQACAYVDVLIFCLNKITQNPDKKSPQK